MENSSDDVPQDSEMEDISEEQALPEADQHQLEDKKEAEQERRPSRRAAQLAVKKIHNIARNLALSSAEVPVENEPTAHTSRRPSKPPKIQVKRAQERRVHTAICVEPIPIDLEMECYEELLTIIQTKTMMKAQAEYNKFMKALRNYKASNARIVYLNEEEPIISSDESESSDSSDDDDSPDLVSSTSNNRSPNLVSLTSNNHSSNRFSLTSSNRSPNVVSLTSGNHSPNLVSLSSVSQPSSCTITVVPVRFLAMHASGVSSANKPPSSFTVTSLDRAENQ